MVIFKKSLTSLADQGAALRSLLKRITGVGADHPESRNTKVI